MKKFKFTISGKPYEVEVQNIEGNIATVNVNGTDYQVEMEEQAAPVIAPVARPAAKPAASAPAQSAAPKPAAAAGGAGYKMAAPLPGTIMQIFVKQGDAVKKGRQARRRREEGRQAAYVRSHEDGKQPAGRS